MPHQLVGKGSSEDEPSHYKVLGLPRLSDKQSNLSTSHIKAAYRRALLQHHPDKTREPSITSYALVENVGKKIIATYTVDQISKAYAILSVPNLRAEYDQALKLQPSTEITGQGGDRAFHSGLETLDLDDLAYDEVDGAWYRGCRCGDERGFLIYEQDLEQVADVGEIYVGCRGCSLWLRLLFGVVEDERRETRV